MGTFNYKGKDFLLNDKKFVIRSGAIHYFRIPSDYWKDRLLKLKECGFNTVETYVAWNLHEPEEGHFVFENDLDLGRFIDTATELGLYVIIRPGPYICAEFDMGGFPAWLLSYKNIKLRCSEPLYLEKVSKYINKVLEIVIPRLITNNGNVLMLQVENEYGSFGNDKVYLKYLVDLYRSLGADCLLFTSDGPMEHLLEAGTYCSECLPTINFGGATEDRMKTFTSWLDGKEQPMMCAEFWCGWFDYWHLKRPQKARTAQDVVNELEVFLKNDYSFNLYMFCGGTNFGFTNGATDVVENRYHAIATNYDYSAPLSESGDRTEKYYAIREIIKKYGIEVPKITAEDKEKRVYGQVEFIGKADLFNNMENIGKIRQGCLPYYMEEVGQSSGYILYECEIPNFTKPNECEQSIYLKPLKLINCSDRAIVFMDGVKIGTYEKGVDDEAVFEKATCKAGAKIQILVENLGRINYRHDLYVHKGIEEIRYGNITFYGYKTVSLPMNNLEKLNYDKLENGGESPAFYKGKFYVDKVCDTFVKPSGFTKGFIVVNGVNLGRFYNTAGPQKTLYLPAPYLRKGENEIIIFESDKVNELKVEFVDAPIVEKEQE